MLDVEIDTIQHAAAAIRNRQVTDADDRALHDLLRTRHIKHRGDKEIRKDHQESRLDHSRRCRSTHCFRSTFYSEALHTTHLDNDGGEHQALHQPGEYVAEKNGVCNISQVDGESHIHLQVHEDSPRQDPEHATHDGEAG